MNGVTRRGLWCVALAALSVGARAARADRLTWRLAVETGPEYDTNPHRLVADGTVGEEGAVVTKTGMRLRTSWRRTDRERLVFAGFAGAKLFTREDEQSENVAIVDADARYERRVRSRRALLGLRGTYHDEYDYELFESAGSGLGARPFAGADGEGSVTLFGPGLHRLTGHAGYRNFRYKSNHKYDWQGDHYGLLYQTTTWLGDPDQDLDAASIDLSAWYRLSRRGFDTLVQRNICGDQTQVTSSCIAQGFDLTPVTGLYRTDLHHRVGGELVYTGNRLLSARYEAQLTDSNSFGRSVLRHRFEVGVTTEAWAGVFVTARAVLQLSTCRDPTCLGLEVQEVEPSDPLASIEDENRNSISLHLMRDLGEDWSIEGRYVRFSSEFAAGDLRYRRQTVYAGMVYRMGSR